MEENLNIPQWLLDHATSLTVPESMLQNIYTFNFRRLSQYNI